MKFNKTAVNLVVLIILLSLSVVVIYVALEEFGVITHKIEYPPYEVPKQ